MFDPFFEPDLPNVRERYFDNGFMIESEMYELEDDFFSNLLSEQLKGDEDVIIPKRRKETQEIIGSAIGMIDICEPETTTMVFGSRDVKLVASPIIPDFMPAIQVLKYMFQYFENVMTPYPYVDVAEPIVPENLKPRKDVTFGMEREFLRRGYLVYDPPYEIRTSEDPDRMLEPCKEFSREDKERIKKNPYVFSSRGSQMPSLEFECNVVRMEFNPTHPMAIPYIRTIKEEKGVVNNVNYACDIKIVRGEYEWGRHTYKFKYDVTDRRYRIHSDVWARSFGTVASYMSMFDLVGNFDFYSEESKDFFSLFKGRKKISTVTSQMIMPYSVLGPIHEVYSPMICARVGIGGRVYSSAMSVGVDIYSKELTDHPMRHEAYRSGLVSCEDVTNDYVARYDVTYGTSIYNKHTQELVYTVLIKDKRYEVRSDPALYFHYTAKDGLVRVLKVRKKNDANGEVRVLVHGGFFFDVPRNSTGCLIPPFGFMTIKQSYDICHKDPSAYAKFVTQIDTIEDYFGVKEEVMTNMDKQVVDGGGEDYSWLDRPEVDKEESCVLHE